MKKYIIFGNCQAGQISYFLSKILDSSTYTVEHISNNMRTGNMESTDVILSKISQCDIFVYQPLGDTHGKLSASYILNILKPSCITISFPYIFNSGIYSLCHAPQTPKNSYGVIYGEDIIMDYLNSGFCRKKIVKDYEKGEIDFKLRERFDTCINIMSSKENSTDIKLVEFIKNNYKKEKLFLTHNHPTNSVFFEMIRQIGEYTGLDLKLTNTDVFSLLGKTNCPISPYDIRIHNYKFKSDDDWFIQGKKLINLVVNEFLEKKCETEGVDLELSVGVIHSNNVTINDIKIQQDIKIIRDAAIALEKENIYTSMRLMDIVHEKHPAGPFIRKKLEEYRSLINT